MNKSYTLIIIAILLAGVSVLFVSVFQTPNDMPEITEGRIQAVFLADGQVYFGTLSNHNGRFAELRNVYYLKYGKSLQQGAADGGENASNLNLVKLGGEVHGPEDAMYISKDKILFVENLKELSNVVQAMRRNGVK